jgi:hypothetical protein
MEVTNDICEIKKGNLEYGENTNYPEKTALFVAQGLM